MWGMSEYPGNLVLPSKCCIPMFFSIFPYLQHLTGSRTAGNSNFVDVRLLKSCHLTHTAPKSSNLSSESRSSDPKCSEYDSKALLTVTKPWKTMEIHENHEKPWKPVKTMKTMENHENTVLLEKPVKSIKSMKKCPLST